MSSEAWLVKSDGTRFPLRGNWSVGRSSSNQAVLSDDRVSRRHALIHAQEGDEYWLVDLGSANGTYLNGRRVSQPTILRGGDTIQVADTTFVFHRTVVPIAVGDETLAGRTVMDIRSQDCWMLVADIISSTQLAQKHPENQIPAITGRWFLNCGQAIQASGGVINKFLGDGFLAYWPKVGALEPFVKSLAELKALQTLQEPAFRMALHYGQVYFGGVATKGEESLSGREVNFLFRMEKLAGSISTGFILSQPAQERLAAVLPTRPIGKHALSGYEGQFPFFEG